MGAQQFEKVTETPGILISRQALDMNYTRYRVAAELAKGKHVLEVACGSGQGLGYLASCAASVTAGDIDSVVLNMARQHYQNRARLLRFDAVRLPFKDGSFDVIVLFEAIYYLSDAVDFLNQCRRVLKPDGLVLLCTANKELADFNPSPSSTRYYSAREIAEILERTKFKPDLYAAFRVPKHSRGDRVISGIKRTAVSLNLIPKTMKGKQLLKRIFLGKLVPMPRELKEGMASFEPPQPISAVESITDFKVIFAIGRNS